MDVEETADPWQMTDTESYWFGEFSRLGMCSPQAEILAAAPGLDRHMIRATLEAGCDPDMAFLIFS